jgi:hemerythrin-like domain-containing protein
MCDHCGCRKLPSIARLMDEHDSLRELAGQIRRSLDTGDEPAARLLLAIAAGVLGPHVAKEEQALFPRLRADQSLADHVDALEREHTGLHAALASLDEPGHDWAAETLALLDVLREHIYKEDFGLFPAALVTLDGADWDAIDEEVSA